MISDNSGAAHHQHTIERIEHLPRIFDNGSRAELWEALLSWRTGAAIMGLPS
jgi:hypothetical protein